MSNLKSKESKQEILRNGIKTDFWKLILNALDDSIKRIEDNQKDISELPADQYKLENELIIKKIEFLKTLKKTPDNLIDWLEETDNKEDDFDPYED